MTSGRLGNVELKTASGDITVEHVAGFRVQSASGDVRGVTVDGEARIQTVSGDVRLGTVTGPVTATLVSGDFAIDAALIDLSAKTVSGDQRIGAIQEGQISVQSVSGDVRIGVRPGRASGSTPTRRAVTSAPSSMSRKRRQRDPLEPRRGWPAKTVSGDIEITRAAAVSA